MQNLEAAVLKGGAVLFASEANWTEGEAIRQLESATSRRGATAVAGMPDIHPGKYGPVGSVILCDGVLHPDLVGNDVGCGMALFSLGIPARRIKVDKAASRLAGLDREWEDEARERGLAKGFPPEHVRSLGTVGGGNHFCEIQAAEEVLDAGLAGFQTGEALLLVHSGSRSMGNAVLSRHWSGGSAGLEGSGADAYLRDHDEAMRFARFNRALIAARAADALKTGLHPVFDVPHNFVERTFGGFLHRKGAAPSGTGPVPVPGSRGSRTYLLEGLEGDPRALGSMSHGAGRKHDRRWMDEKARHDRRSRELFGRNPVGGRVVCADTRLAVQESPMAYKDIETVVSDLEGFALARKIASMRPVVTYKSGRGS